MNPFLITDNTAISFSGGRTSAYLLWKVWNVFGFWNIIGTGIIASLSSVIFGRITSSRSKKNEVVTYNPKEWPKFLTIGVMLLLGFYLYSILPSQKESNEDYIFGLAYLIIFTAIPTVWSTFKIIRDRNDFVKFDSQKLWYKDNDNTGTYKFSEVAEIFPGLTLMLNNGEVVEIKLKNMNFTPKDKSELYQELYKKVSTGV
ncbi:MAG: hypothetical protein EBX50_20390 [Chitinophagia bacterium]|nr:hypothetical protein [Chitinophagia bacterium]